MTTSLVVHNIIPGDCLIISGPLSPGLSMATVHGPPAIHEKDQGLGFRYKWLAGLVSRVCMVGLASRVCPSQAWSGGGTLFLV